MDYMLYGQGMKPTRSVPAVEALFQDLKGDPRDLDLDFRADFLPSGNQSGQWRADSLGHFRHQSLPRNASLNFNDGFETDHIPPNFMALDVPRNESLEFTWRGLDTQIPQLQGTQHITSNPILDSQFEGRSSASVAAMPEALMTTSLPDSMRSSNDSEQKVYLKPEDIRPPSKSSSRNVERQEKERQKAEKLKEKNKRAQRKFRQRQKDRQESAERLASDLADQLKRVQMEKVALELRNQELELSCQKASTEVPQKKSIPQSEQTPDFVPATGWSAYHPQRGMVLVATTNLKLTHEHFMSLSLRDVCKIMAESVKRLRDALHDLETNQDPVKATQRIQALVDERHALVSYIAVNKASALYQFLCTKACDPPDENAPQPGMDYWEDVTADIVLNPAQMNNLLDARRIFLRKMDKLLIQRDALMERIKVQKMRVEPSEVASVSMLHLQWSDLIDDFRENTDMAHRCNAYLMSRIWYGDCFTCTQIATMIVRSWPYQVNIFAIMRCLVNRVGAPNHVEQIMAERLKLDDDELSPIDRYVESFPRSSGELDRKKLETSGSSDSTRPEIYHSSFVREPQLSSLNSI